MAINIIQMTFAVTIGVKRMMDESERFKDFVAESVRRHMSHDWGDLCEEDKALNDADPESAMSTYKFDDNFKIWVKTEGEHIIVLLPSEY